jgi:hypothetical protein
MGNKEYFLNKLNNICKWSFEGFLRFGVPCTTDEINDELQSFEGEFWCHFWPMFKGDTNKDSDEFL